VEAVSIDEEWRRRLKFLAHLPHGASLALVEPTRASLAAAAGEEAVALFEVFSQGYPLRAPAVSLGEFRFT